MEYQRDEHRVHLIAFHLIGCPKRRKAGLTGPIANDCKSLIEAKCNQRGWHVERLDIQPDHVHLFVRVWPADSAADVLKAVKRITSFELRQQYPELKRLPAMGTRSDFASTVGRVSQEAIQRYIEAQKGL